MQFVLDNVNNPVKCVAYMTNGLFNRPELCLEDINNIIVIEDDKNIVNDLQDISSYKYKKEIQSAIKYCNNRIHEIDQHAQKREAKLFRMFAPDLKAKWLQRKKRLEYRLNFWNSTSPLSKEVVKQVSIKTLLDIPRINMINCIWHTEKSPSLKYYPKSNTLYCFGACQRSYDVIDVAQKIHKTDFKGALKILSGNS